MGGAGWRIFSLCGQPVALCMLGGWSPAGEARRLRASPSSGTLSDPRPHRMGGAGEKKTHGRLGHALGNRRCSFVHHTRPRVQSGNGSGAGTARLAPKQQASLGLQARTQRVRKQSFGRRVGTSPGAQPRPAACYRRTFGYLICLVEVRVCVCVRAGPAGSKGARRALSFRGGPAGERRKSAWASRPRPSLVSLRRPPLDWERGALWGRSHPLPSARSGCRLTACSPPLWRTHSPRAWERVFHR